MHAKAGEDGRTRLTTLKEDIRRAKNIRTYEYCTYGQK
jgi:hypothetical protein